VLARPGYRRPILRQRASRPQLKRDPLGRTMSHSVNRLLPLLFAGLGVLTDDVIAQRRCDDTPNPDSTSVDAIFLARLDRTESYTEMIRVDTVTATWPMVRFYLRPRLGWKLNPLALPGDWYPDTLGHFLIAVRPEHDPQLPANAWVMVYMKVAYSEIIERGDSGLRHLKGQGMLQLIDCGLRFVSDTSLGRRLYGPPQWLRLH